MRDNDNVKGGVEVHVHVNVSDKRATLRISRALTIAIVLGLGAVGLARPEAVLTGGIPWLGFLFFVLSGWGWIVMRITRVADCDFGMRAAWGLCGYLALAGMLVMFGICNRPAIVALLAIGAAGFAWRELVTEAPLWHLVRRGAKLVREQPIVAALALALGAAAVIHLIGAVVHLDHNPWDDDVAYTPLHKRLLDVGNLVEPFSFRRLAAYGGQIALQALGGARGTLASVDLIDKGLCFGLVLLLVVGHARRVAPFWLGALVLMLLLLPDTAVNTASYWSGVVVFLALYRTVAASQLVLAALVGAAACSLRQSYIPVVAVFLGLTLVLGTERRSWRRALAVGAIAIVPWCIAAFVSSRTFLFPFMQGTWNHGLALKPTAASWVDELSLFITSCIDAQPLVIGPLLVLLLAVTRDGRAGRPLTAMFVACVTGFVLLVHSFTAADSSSLWRYAFGYTLALALAFIVEVGDDADDQPVRLAPLGRWLLLAALIVQLAFARAGVVKRYALVFHDVREALAIDRHGDPSAREERRRYAAMQAAVPEGASLVVMLDDPAFLDFRRNSIANLDTPGFASPAAQLPSFGGAQAMRAYLLDQGLRYVAFVRPDRSRYVFRREFWVWRLFNDNELFQAMSAYMIDTIDALGELSTTTHKVYERDGLVVLDLAGPHEPAPRFEPADEAIRREAFVRALADREQLHGAWALTTHHDVVFEDGMSSLTFVDTDADAHWYDVLYRDPEPARGAPVRWLYRRGHVRVRGDADMHLSLRGRVNLNAVYTRPRLDISLDGELLASATVDAHGVFAVQLVVPKAAVAEWSDLYLVWNAIGQPERDVKDLKIARLEDFAWEP